MICSYYLIANAIYDLSRYARYSSSFKKEKSKINQQAWITLDYHKIEKGLSIPNPRLGFGEKWIESEFLPQLERYYSDYGFDQVVGSCVGAMLFNYERNHIWIDGGLFSMTLAFALHSLNLGSCMLNICMLFTREKSCQAFIICPQ